MVQISFSFAGIYTGGNWTVNFCVDGDSFTASINTATGAAYASGRCDSIAQVCNGEYIDGNQLGVILFAAVSTNVIHVDYYFGDYDDFNLPQPSLRHALDLSKTSNDVFPPQCQANQYLSFVGTFNDPIYGGTFSICYDSSNGLLTGLYSEIGVVRGYFNSLSGMWSGQWFEAGTAYDNHGIETYGPVAFAPIDYNSFSGKYGFGDTSVTPDGE